MEMHTAHAAHLLELGADLIRVLAGVASPLGLGVDHLAHPLPNHLGFGRIAASETEAPNTLVSLV
jgi:hypothetical protein